jgi:hypothetical protein
LRLAHDDAREINLDGCRSLADLRHAFLVALNPTELRYEGAIRAPLLTPAPLTREVPCCLSAESGSVIKGERRRTMTGRADFTQEEWELVLEGPPSAGMIVVTAQRGGTFRESIAMAKAYVEARRQHGESELLDEIVAAKPERDHTRYHSVEELKQHGLQHLRDAVELLERKASAEEVEDYRRFVLTLADRVANAHREGGEAVSDAERTAIEEISASLGKADR